MSPTLKRFLAFAYQRYYPAGGWDDFVGSFDSVEDAEACVAERLRQSDAQVEEPMGHVVDTAGDDGAVVVMLLHWNQHDGPIIVTRFKAKELGG